MINLKTGGLLVAMFIAGAFVASPELRAYAAATITSADIVDNTIQSVDIKNGTLIAQDLANGAVTNSKLAANSVGSTKINDGSVLTQDIGNGAVMSADIGSGAVTNTKVASEAIDSSKIMNGQVNTADIGDGAVTNSKLAANSVDTSKIVDGTIQGGKGGDILDSSIQDYDLAANSVIPTHIQTDAVGADELAGVSKLIFVECTVMLNTAINPGSFQMTTCNAPGAALGDGAIASLTNSNACFAVTRSDPNNNRVELIIRNVCTSSSTPGQVNFSAIVYNT